MFNNDSEEENRYLIFGGAGSLGTALVRRILQMGDQVTVFSRDEAKHYHQRNALGNHPDVKYVIGDIRDANRVNDVISLSQCNRVINAAAIKQVPLCEEYPEEAVKTNVIGSMNIARGLRNNHAPVKAVSISTDKACKPINAYGHTKALQEKIHLNANDQHVTANVVRYGNVLCSTGSVVPYFKNLLEQNRKLTVTDELMTRFLLSLDDAVDLIFSAFKNNEGGNIFVPQVRSAYITDVASVLCEAYGKQPGIQVTKIRPGEKLNEILISEEEGRRTAYNQAEDCFEVKLREPPNKQFSYSEDDFSSGDTQNLLNKVQLYDFLQAKGVLPCAKSESPEERVSSDKTSPPIWKNKDTMWSNTRATYSTR